MVQKTDLESHVTAYNKQRQLNNRHAQTQQTNIYIR
jgi:hypothetical protein